MSDASLSRRPRTSFDRSIRVRVGKGSGNNNGRRETEVL